MSAIVEFQGGNRFLSNFYPVQVEFEGLTFPSAENAYQAAKTLDPRARRLFLKLTPSQAKQLGRSIPLRLLWDESRLQIMEQIVTIKFQDEYLADLLIQTHPRKLIEGNHWGDTFWGMVYSRTENKWEGKNHLGLILMQVRKNLLT